jgi:hypothetical protein
MSLTNEQKNRFRNIIKSKKQQTQEKNVVTRNIKSVNDNKNFSDKVRDLYESRGMNALESANSYLNKEQTGVETVFQFLGEGAGLVGDVGFEGIKDVASFLTPDFIEKPVTDLAKDVLTSKPVTNVVNKINDFEQDNPRLSRNVNSILNIGELFAVPKVSKLSKEAAESASKQALKSIPENFSKEYAKNFVKRQTDNLKKGVVETRPFPNFVRQKVSDVIPEKYKSFAVEKTKPYLERRKINKIDKLSAKNELNQAPIAVKNAVNLGVDIRDAKELAKITSPQMKAKAKSLLSSAIDTANGINNIKPFEVAGKEFFDLYKKVDSARKNAGKKLGDYTKNILPEKLKNTKTNILNRLKQVEGLESIELRLFDNKWELDFSNTRLSTNKKAQKEIEFAFQNASKRNARQQHLYRQELFDILGVRDAKRVKELKTTADKGLEAVRQGIADTLSQANSQYKKLNKNYVELENAMKSSRRALGKSLKGSDKVKAQKFGQILRRTTSNASADSLSIIEDLQNAIKILGGKNNIDLVQLQDILNIIEKYFDITQRTSLKGQTGDMLGNMPTSVKDISVGVLKKAGNFIIGDMKKTDATRIQAISDLINSL